MSGRGREHCAGGSGTGGPAWAIGWQAACTCCRVWYVIDGMGRVNQWRADGFGRWESDRWAGLLVCR